MARLDKGHHWSYRSSHTTLCETERFWRAQFRQLHHFSDASEEGYGAVSYLCLTDALGNIACSILLGKARVAPLKTVTEPRLELTAATVAVKLHKQIKEELTLPIHEVTFSTDSTIVLQYINNSHTRFQTFVSNRLATIHDISTPSQWRHVSSDLNPADYASRGFNSHERTKLKIWLEGPRFLLKDESQWPNQPTQLPEIDKNDQNVKRSKKVQAHTVMQDQGFDSLVYHYSSWYGLKKALASRITCCIAQGRLQKKTSKERIIRPRNPKR